MTAEDIADTLGMARSNVSNSIKELLAWNLIRRVPILGDRRDHFEAETDIWEVAARIAAGRKEREIDPAIAALRACVSDAADDPAISCGREQAAEGDARFHRAGRSLVRADAERAAAAAGGPDQARREDRQPPADGKIEIAGEVVGGNRNARSERWRQQDYPMSQAPPDILLDDFAFARCFRDEDWGRLPLAVWRRFSKRLAGGKTVVYVGEVEEVLPQPRRLVAGAARAPDRRAAADRHGKPCPDDRDGDRGRRERRTDLDAHLRAQRRLPAGHPFRQALLPGRPGSRNISACGIGMALRLSVEHEGCFFRSAGYFLCIGQLRLRASGLAHAGRTDGEPHRSRRRPVSLHARRDPSPSWRADPPVRGIRGGCIMTPLLWTLIAIQVVMGAFDTLYHHELTERLAWRPSQRHELQLHAVRNVFYALLFLVLGWLEVTGFLAMIVIAVLVGRARHHADGFRRGRSEPQAAAQRARQSHAACAQLWRDPGPAAAGPDRLGATAAWHQGRRSRLARHCRWRLRHRRRPVRLARLRRVPAPGASDGNAGERPRRDIIRHRRRCW